MDPEILDELRDVSRRLAHVVEVLKRRSISDKYSVCPRCHWLFPIGSRHDCRVVEDEA